VREKYDEDWERNLRVNRASSPGSGDSYPKIVSPYLHIAALHRANTHDRLLFSSYTGLCSLEISGNLISSMALSSFFLGYDFV